MKKKKKIMVLMVLILLIFATIFAFALARYAANSIWDYYLKAKGFYFKSSQLSLNGTKNVNTNWDGQSVYFDLKNYSNSAITEFDIDYKVSCEITNNAKDAANCVIKESNNNQYTGVLSTSQYCKNNKDDNVDVSAYSKTKCELDGYEWAYQKSIKDFYFDIVPIDENAVIKDVDVVVKINSMKPYQEQLTGTFILSKSDQKAEDVTLEVANNSTISNLIIKNSYLTSKCVTLSWEASQIRIVSDKTLFNDSTSNAEGIVNQVKIILDKTSSKSLDFYKASDNKIDTNMFTVNVENSC